MRNLLWTNVFWGNLEIKNSECFKKLRSTKPRLLSWLNLDRILQPNIKVILNEIVTLVCLFNLKDLLFHHAVSCR